ncbi:long-chain fatty acid--CoA ligase [Phycicoccus sp. BSK3Z-2]|uniref:Long-chain fatty acid--CoA ligase n=1 Tax=Phycicoccus avicenniae TaxID=2828860 RepID=A0A941D8N2_9MICO|nr:fatty acid--CoA ligase family protein [Phycicoccus avicenniae]MBR7742517.1 long-chain fatty acid--CoA ligase [Phycicoccus avicenniae]
MTVQAIPRLAAPQATAGTSGTPEARAATVLTRTLERLACSDDAALLTPDRALTGREVVARVRATAGALADAGAGPGTVVAVLTGPNDPDVVVGRYAARLVGAGVVHLRSMNPRTDEEAFGVEAQLDVLDRTGAVAVVVDAASLERATTLRSHRPLLRVVPVGTDAATDGPAAVTVVPVPTPDAACAVVDVTSGTTGAPRLVRQSHRSRERLVERLADDLGSAPVHLLSVTPATHTTAPMLDAVLLSGGSVVLHRRFDPGAVLGAVEGGVTDLYLAVPHLCALLDDPRTATADLRSLRRVVYSGTPAAPHRVAAARRVLGRTVVQVYGTTETGGISALTPEDHDEPVLHGTVGRPFPWVDVEVRDPDTGESLPRGHAGAVWVRSGTTADGYWGEDPSALTRDGWVATGDLGALEPHGRLRLVGRLAGVIKLGGLKIYPAAIESALREHPSVSDAVVHGIRDAERREAVHAVVVPRAGQVVDEDELVAHVTARLSATHAPTRVVVWTGVPLTRSGKPDRRLVRELLGG